MPNRSQKILAEMMRKDQEDGLYDDAYNQQKEQ